MILSLNTYILLLMMLIAPQAYWIVKLPFLGVTVLLAVLGVLYKKFKIRNRYILTYYCVFGIIALIWSFIGLMYGNPAQAVIESVKMYFGYMWVYCFLVLYLSNINYLRYLDGFFGLVAMGISVLCFYTILDQMYNIGILSESFKEAMFMQAGFHFGYTQINNVNIGVFTFVLPYLVSRIIMAKVKKSYWVVLIFLISLTAVLLASRRIVIFLVVISPVLCYLFGLHFKSNIRAMSAKLMIYGTIFVGTLFTIGLLSYANDPYMFFSFIDRITEIFVIDTRTVRQLQHEALIEGFRDYPFFGSGFGGLTEVIRSYDRPWTYELTYSKLLYNMGAVGMSLLAVFHLIFLFLCLRKIKYSNKKEYYVPMMVGYIGVLIGTASNPYLSSFDFLFSISIVPLILNTRETPVQREMT